MSELGRLRTQVVALENEGMEMAARLGEAEVERDRYREALVTLCDEIDEAVESCDINRAAEARNTARGSLRA